MEFCHRKRADTQIMQPTSESDGQDGSHPPIPTPLIPAFHAQMYCLEQQSRLPTRNCFKNIVSPINQMLYLQAPHLMA